MHFRGQNALFSATQEVVIVSEDVVLVQRLAAMFTALAAPAISHEIDLDAALLRLLGRPATFWVVDMRVPRAQALVGRLLRERHRCGLLLSEAVVHGFVAHAIRAGVRSMVLDVGLGNRPLVIPQAQLYVTDREREIVAHVAQGQANAVIAKELGISPMTVKAHLARIFKRLGANDRAELVMICLRLGFID